MYIMRKVGDKVNKQMFIKTSFAIILFSLLCVIVPVDAYASSVSTNMNVLKRYETEMKRMLRSDHISYYGDFYEKVKKKYVETMKEVGRMKNGKVKREYMIKLKKVNDTMEHFLYYVKAMEQGQKLKQTATQVDRALRDGNINSFYNLYPVFEQQLKDMVYFSSKTKKYPVYSKMFHAFLQPAIQIKNRSYAPINTLYAFDQVIDCYEKDQIDEVEKLISLCDQFIKKVVDKKTKERLVILLEEVKKPIIIDIQ